MASKVMLEKFQKKVIKAVEKLGGKIVLDDINRIEMEIQTKAGQLDIFLHKPTEKSKLFSIFSRFENVDKANATLTKSQASNLNDYSGKWNFHYLSEEDCLNTFYMDLAELMDK